MFWLYIKIPALSTEQVELKVHLTVGKQSKAICAQMQPNDVFVQSIYYYSNIAWQLSIDQRKPITNIAGRPVSTLRRTPLIKSMFPTRNTLTYTLSQYSQAHMSQWQIVYVWNCSLSHIFSDNNEHHNTNIRTNGTKQEQTWTIGNNPKGIWPIETLCKEAVSHPNTLEQAKMADPTCCTEHEWSFVRLNNSRFHH